MKYILYVIEVSVSSENRIFFQTFPKSLKCFLTFFPVVYFQVVAGFIYTLWLTIWKVKTFYHILRPIFPVTYMIKFPALWLSNAF